MFTPGEAPVTATAALHASIYPLWSHIGHPRRTHLGAPALGGRLRRHLPGAARRASAGVCLWVGGVVYMPCCVLPQPFEGAGMLEDLAFPRTTPPLAVHIIDCVVRP